MPLDYAKPHGKAIKLFGRTTTRYERPLVDPAPDDAKSAQKPYLVFLQGGPGFGNPAPDSSPLTRHMLDRGYELLLLDYRGVGNSCPVTPESLSLVGGPQEQADYLKLFRADNIVRDCEAVRKCLTRDYPPEKKQWSIFGQSFGGMTSKQHPVLFIAPSSLDNSCRAPVFFCLRRTGLSVLRTCSRNAYS